MDDDYDNYVPQISTMDWQNLGQDNESSQMRVESSASAMGSSGSGSYLYGVAGASIPVAGRSQHHQRSFPGMGMPTQPFGVAEYGQGQVHLRIINLQFNQLIINQVNDKSFKNLT